MNDKEKSDLIKRAIEARAFAYAPYSGFSVGAAVLCADGSVFTGCNVENASYPCGICAERTAAAKAVGEGRRDIIAAAIVGSSAEKCTPCGVCRQFLFEFAPDMIVLCGDKDGNYAEYKLSGLLPEGFGPGSLG
ncbi:MAG: cytidine deaminase [Ruminiclostridium sp.]|nr:cytidine deaminase [Ruminiclostridium sp.]